MAELKEHSRARKQALVATPTPQGKSSAPGPFGRDARDGPRHGHAVPEEVQRVGLAGRHPGRRAGRREPREAEDVLRAWCGWRGVQTSCAS